MSYRLAATALYLSKHRQEEGMISQKPDVEGSLSDEQRAALEEELRELASDLGKSLITALRLREVLHALGYFEDVQLSEEIRLAALRLRDEMA